MDVSGECSICFESLKDETSLVRLTSCGHYFHRSCLDNIVEKNKVKLPYELWSMDKLKPTTDAVNKWIKKYSDYSTKVS